MKRIGKYEIRGELGKGGMGIVYEAYDPLIDRPVALKLILDRALELSEMKERFYREARAAGRISHQNITVVYDSGEIDGKPYLVMEYLDGVTLRDLMDNEGSLSLAQKVEIARQIATGLQFAHAKKVIHRDIKPENIMVVEDNLVKIMDFGIAKPEASTLTQTGMMVGTPYYMSPEQIRGLKVDKRSDIFAFGVLLFELCSSAKPFTGEQVNAVLYCVVHEPPNELMIDGDADSEELERIIARCLEKEPDDRYQDFSEVVRDLQGIITHLEEPVDLSASTVRLPQPGEDTLKGARKRTARRWAYMSAGLVAAVSLAIAGWQFWPDLKPPTDVGLHHAALTAKTTMDSLKTVALNLRANVHADSLFDIAIEEERQGDGNLNDGRFAEAESLYRSASEKYSIANSFVLSLASQTRTNHAKTANAAELDKPDGDMDRKQPSTIDKPVADVTPRRHELLDSLDAAEKMMRAARDSVLGTESDKYSNATYRKAVDSQTRAQGRRDAGDYAGALRLVGEATDGYRSARQSILSALTSRADSAKARMTAQKRSINSEWTSSAKYREASAAEEKGDEAYENGQFALASQHYLTALTLYADVGVVAEAEFNQSIEDFKDAYKTSLEKGDLQGLRSLYKSFSEDEEKKWRNAFRISSERQVNVAEESRRFAGAKVDLDVMVRFTYKDNKNRSQPPFFTYATWTLERVEGRWLIVDLVEKER